MQHDRIADTADGELINGLNPDQVPESTPEMTHKQPEGRTGPDVGQIQKIALECSAEAFGVSVEDIIGKKRETYIKFARFASVCIMREAEPGLTLQMTAEAVGRTNHATTLHALRRVLEWTEIRDRKFCDGISRAKAMFDRRLAELTY